MSRLIAITVTAILLSGCATQPDYRSPATSRLAEWTNGTDHASTADVEDAEHEVWWTALRDPAIDALVSAGLVDNPTLAEAAARVDQAKAIYAVERAQRSPRVDVIASAARERVGIDGGTGTATSWQSSAGVGPSLSWEIDLWGRVRENTLAAHRRLQARDADARDARLSIAAEVADGVLSLRACNLLLKVRDADIASRENELAIIRTRARLGMLPPVDVAAADSNLAIVRIDRIAQEEACLQTVDALVAMTGRSADEVQSRVASLVTDTGVDLSAQVPSAPAIVPDLPATVLLAHPAVVAAEREVAARWSQIATARAERLPRLDLTAVLTGQWIRAFGSTVSFTTGSAGLGLAAPLFDSGAGAAEVAYADARYREAVATLEVTIRRATRDIEDGLAAQDSALQRAEVSRSAMSAARYALRANEARRRAGSIGGFELEESRRQLNRAQESAILAARDRAQAWVALVRRSNSFVQPAVMGAGAAAFVSSFAMELPQ
jgi:NodT family efflux transporter outer membrane factor (OMF) lipoprotein